MRSKEFSKRDLRGAARLVALAACTIFFACSTDGVSGEGEAESESESEGEVGGLINPACGALTIDTKNGADLTVTSPQGVLSLLVAVDGAGADLIAVETITNPAGTVIYDRSEVPPYGGARTDPNDILITTLLPESAEVLPAAGDYMFHVIGELAAPLDVTASCVAKTGPSPDGVVLDVAHHFVDQTIVNATNAQTDPNFAMVLDRIESTLASIGVQLGQVTFDDIDNATLASIDSVDGPDSEFAQLMALAPSDRKLHVYYVEQISGEEAFVTIGQSGGVPGPATFGGTGRSAVAVTTADLASANPDDIAFLGLTAAHEILHFMGLFHTTEKCASKEATEECDLVGSDPITDTPECAPAADTDTDGILSAAECAGAGADNVMFWSPGSDAMTLTEHQGFVVRRNPLAQ